MVDQRLTFCMNVELLQGDGVAEEQLHKVCANGGHYSVVHRAKNWHTAQCAATPAFADVIGVAQTMFEAINAFTLTLSSRYIS